MNEKKNSGEEKLAEAQTANEGQAPLIGTPGKVVPVTLKRAAAVPTPDLPLWIVIRKSTNALSFNNYRRFINIVLCGEEPPEQHDYESDRIAEKREAFKDEKKGLKGKRFLPFTDVEAYRLLKAATEAFVMVNCGVPLEGFLSDSWFTSADLDELVRRVGVDLGPGDLEAFWEGYLVGTNGDQDPTLPYLAMIRAKFPEAEQKFAIFNDDVDREDAEECYGFLREKFTHPCLLELIWSYWHEEGMLVQTMNAISLRFQNKRGSSDRDPLAQLEIDPLRPLNNLLWGMIQDEQHRLPVTRRNYEYDHHYGIRLLGRSIRSFRPADSRSKFLEAFHNLFYLSSIFYQQDDDTTVIADAFPLLNGLREVHVLLSEGAHNQFGDLPSTARIEMLMQQWLLARPEFREFLPTRVMVAYPEPWMDRVDSMKKLQKWTDTNVLHFRNLGVFGEQILLSIRFGAWANAIDAATAGNWARFWRPEIQGYIHAYRAATGVDLTSEPVDNELPAAHLQRRLTEQRR